MGFMDKLKAALRKIRTKLIVYAVMVVIILIEPLAPLVASIKGAEIEVGKQFFGNGLDGDIWQAILTKLFGEEVGIVKPFHAFITCWQDEYRSMYFTGIKNVLIIAVFFALIGIIRALPKHEYENIENGSSDWSENGEQYKVLNKKKGIVLAEKNYLPVDKRGNVNVLVVRRFWCW